MKNIKQNIIQTLKIIGLSLILSTGIGVALAWTGPTATPPNNNTDEPLNTSNDWQIKYGYLSLPKIIDSNTGQTGYYLDPGANSWLYRLYAKDIRSSIFYDQDNTGYYVDPASTSRMNAITPNSISLGGVSRSSWPSAAAEADTLATVTARGNTTSNWIQSNSSVRAPIFYDANNTGYYVDPASTSNLNLVYTNDMRSSIYYDKDNTGYYVDPASTSRLNYGIYDNLYSYGWMQSPIFYDANNTGYYVDPASTSNLNLVYTNDMHSSIYYDKDNTGYYVDPASTSKFNTINLGGVSKSSWPSGLPTSPGHVGCYTVNCGSTCGCATGYFLTYIERANCPGAYCAGTCCKPW